MSAMLAVTVLPVAVPAVPRTATICPTAWVKNSAAVKLWPSSPFQKVAFVASMVMLSILN